MDDLAYYTHHIKGWFHALIERKDCMNIEVDRRQGEISKHRFLRKMYEKELIRLKRNLTDEDKKSQMTKNNILLYMCEDNIKWHRQQTAFYRDVNYPVALL